MARYRGAKCRLCRREGSKLFLKGERCYSPKCPIERKGAVPPGQHGPKGKGRRRMSEYGRQLREKQKLKRTYGVLEKQFRRYFTQATKKKKAVGEALLQILELRLDNAVFRLGLVPSRSVARKLVSHGHVLVDNKKVDISSYQVKPNQIISLDSKALNTAEVKKSLAEKGSKTPSWLQRRAAIGKIVRLPESDDFETEINTQLIIEFYSR